MRVTGVIGGLLWLAWTGSAHAQHGFEWQAPTACGSDADIARLVEETLGAPPPPRLRPVRVEVTVAGDRARARISPGDSDDARIVEVEGDCRGLHAPVALVLALILAEPEQVLRTPAAEAPLISAVIGADATLDVGWLGNVAAGGGLHVDVDLGERALALRLGLFGWPAQRDGPGPAVELSGWSLEAGFCGRPFVDRWLWLAGCVGLRAGALSGLGLDVTTPAASSMPFAAPIGVVEADVWPLEVLGIRFAGGLAIPLPRARWTILEDGTSRVLSESSIVAFTGSVSVVLRVGR